NLAEEALRAAEGLVDKADSPTMKAERLTRLASAYAQLDGEIDSNLLDKAFAAVKKISEPPTEETEERKPVRPGYDRGAMLQNQLFPALARADFRSAMERARQLPNEKPKLSAILGILQGLDGSIGYRGFGGSMYR